MKFDRKAHEAYLIEELVGKEISGTIGIENSYKNFSELVERRLKKFKAANKEVNYTKVNYFVDKIKKFILDDLKKIRKKIKEIKHEGFTKKGIDKSDIKIIFKDESHQNYSLKTYDKLQNINMGDRGLFTVSEKLTGKKIVLPLEIEKRRLEFQREYGNTKGNKEEKKKIRNQIKIKNPIYQEHAKQLSFFFNHFLRTNEGQIKFKENFLKDMGFQDDKTKNLLVIRGENGKIITEEPTSIINLRNKNSKIETEFKGVSTIILLDGKEIVKISFRDRGSQCTYWVSFI